MTEPVCPTCHTTTHHQAPLTPARKLAAPAVWMWSSPEARNALATRDLGVILRAYRKLNRLSQERFAAVLGYDKTYVSMIETGRRAISDLNARRHIARTLGLPTHVLGITDTGDGDFASMIQFGDSTIRLAGIARGAGRAVDAVNELWPLVNQLETRAADGHGERDTLMLLAQARLALGVALGDVLPEERLAASATWTGKALLIARRLGDRTHLVRTLRTHGNELRKCNRTSAAVGRLHEALALSIEPEERGNALALLARAAGQLGDADLFDQSIGGYRDLLDRNCGRGMLLNPFTFREIQLRGLISTGHITEAVRTIRDAHSEAPPAAPQWQIIERVTAGQVLLAADEREGAQNALHAALTAAEFHRLPHQVQRIVRAADDGRLDTVAAEGRATLKRLLDLIAPPQLDAADN